MLLPAHIHDLPIRDRTRIIPRFPSPSTIDDFDSFLALAAHFGSRLPEEYTFSPGPVCFALDLQLPEGKDVAPTTLLKECFGKPGKEPASLAGWLSETATVFVKGPPARNRGLATIRRAFRLKHPILLREAFRDIM